MSYFESVQKLSEAIRNDEKQFKKLLYSILIGQNVKIIWKGSYKGGAILGYEIGSKKGVVRQNEMNKIIGKAEKRLNRKSALPVEFAGKIFGSIERKDLRVIFSLQLVK